MSTGPDATFAFLSKTENRCALGILVAALDCPQRPVRDRALLALLTRREPEAQREVFRRLDSLDASSREVMMERSGCLLNVVATALKEADPKVRATACDAILSFRLYDAFPSLIAALVDENDPTTRLAAQVALKLAQDLYKEMGTSESRPGVRDLDTIRRRVTASLEEGARKFSRHHQVELLEAFLLLAKPQNITLRQILGSPNDPVHEAMLSVLSTSPRGGVIRLLLGFLDDPQPPRVVLRAIGAREDRKFAHHLLRKACPSTALPRNLVQGLSRLDAVAWAKPEHVVLAGLGDQDQAKAVRFILKTSVPTDAQLDMIEYLLQQGKPEGRRAAASALAGFEGSRADMLAVRSINDEDLEVRAHLLRQLRPRNIPGAMSLLIRMVGNTAPVIRDALADALPEFGFRQFALNFESLPEQLQLIGGHVVRRIDPDAASLLAEEMRVLSPVRRRRAVNLAKMMGMVRELEEAMIPLVSDEDHMVRIAAAAALAESESVMTWEVLRDALLDRSVIVQEAAEQSLTQISQALKTDFRRDDEPQENPAASTGEVISTAASSNAAGPSEETPR